MGGCGAGVLLAFWIKVRSEPKVLNFCDVANIFFDCLFRESFKDQRFYRLMLTPAIFTPT